MSTARFLLLAWVAACSDGGTTDGDVDAMPREVVVELSPGMPTVVHVRWSTVAEVGGQVEFGVDGTIDRATPPGPIGTTHSATLVGLPEETEVAVRIVSDGEAQDPLSITTGVLAGDPPEVLVTGHDQDSFLLVPVATTIENRIVLLDPAGRVTWSYVDPHGLSVFRALVRQDGGGIVYASALKAGGPAADSAIAEVDWDGVEQQMFGVPDLAHDFVERADGTYVALAYEERSDVLGNQLLEIGADGTANSIWSAWDCYDPAVDIGDDPAQGWTHANALDGDDEGFLISMRNFNSIVRVDAETRTCPWAFGGIVSTVDVSGETFTHQHQFELADDRLLVFDNAGAGGLVSRMVEYTFDQAAATGTFEREIVADPPLFTFILGDVHRFADGDTLVVWSGPGVIDRVAADGERSWRAELVSDGLFGFAHVVAETSSSGN